MSAQVEFNIGFVGLERTADPTQAQAQINGLWSNAVKNESFVKLVQDIGLDACQVSRADCPYLCREEDIPEKLADAFLGAVVIAIFAAPLASLIVYGPDRRPGTILDQGNITKAHSAFSDLWEKWFVPRLPAGYNVRSEMKEDM